MHSFDSRPSETKKEVSQNNSEEEAPEKSKWMAREMKEVDTNVVTGNDSDSGRR